MLKDFCKAYVEWLDAGAPQPDDIHQGFTRTCGLCTNLVRWCRFYGADSVRASNQLTRMLPETEDVDRAAYPFNDGAYQYRMECVAAACHRNEKRVAWVREQAAK